MTTQNTDPKPARSKRDENCGSKRLMAPGSCRKTQKLCGTRYRKP